MKISVVLPTYKPGNFLWECLEALDAQTLDHALYEVLVVLNGPREPYLSQVESFLAKHPALPCRLIYNEPNGVSLARNRGLDEAAGEYVCFVDDDDLVSERYLEALLAVASPETIALPYVAAFDDGSTTLRPIYIANAFRENARNVPFQAVRQYFYVCWGKLIHRDVIGDRRFDPDLRNGEDSQFMLLVSDRMKTVSFTARDVLYKYRQRASSAYYANRSVWYHFTNMLLRLCKATKIYAARPCRYSFRFFATYMLATMMGGVRQMLHRRQ